MGQLSDLKKMIQDRRESDAGIATLEYPFCMAPELVAEYHKLDEAKGKIVDGVKKAGALAADTEDLDAQLEAKAKEIEAVTVRLVFRALPGQQYDDILIKHPGWQNDRAVMNEMYLDLLHECYRYVKDSDGDKHELDLDELLPLATSGVLDDMETEVVDLNRKTPDFPFSSRG